MNFQDCDKVVPEDLYKVYFPMLHCIYIFFQVIDTLFSKFLGLLNLLVVADEESPRKILAASWTWTRVTLRGIEMRSPFDQPRRIFEPRNSSFLRPVKQHWKTNLVQRFLQTLKTNVFPTLKEKVWTIWKILRLQNVENAFARSKFESVWSNLVKKFSEYWKVNLGLSSL